MEHLLYLREQYGDIFVTTLPNGLCVPWKTLSIGDFIKYENLHLTKRYCSAFLEDEIFRKCVLDKNLIKHIDKSRAGTVTTVVAAIMSISGPSDVEEISTILDIHRQTVRSNIIYDIVNLIIQAFPAYKIEEVMDWDYEKLVLRLAQAEKKLLEIGAISEFINFAPLEQKEKVVSKRREINSAELFNLYKKQEGQTGPTPSSATESRVGKKQTIIRKADIIEHESAIVGHEKDVVHLEKEAAETAKIYADYLNKSGDKVKIKTTEERKAEAEARMESNRLSNLQNTKLQQQLDKIEMKKLIEVREQERAKKARKQRGQRR